MTETIANNPATTEMVAEMIRKIDIEMRKLDESAKTL